MLCFHSHFSHFSLLVSQCWNDLNSDFAFRNSPGCLTHPNPASEADLRSDTKLIIGIDFATTRYSSPSVPSCGLFDMLLDLSIVLKWLQEQTEKFIMLNKRRRWFHLSRVKLPLVNKFANWILVSTYLIWIFGSKSTCLIVGLRPLMIILITASLSAIL